jgi:hypothetical protein
MKRINIKLISALVIAIIAFCTVLTNISFAAISISAPDSVGKGDSFTVTVNIPQGAVAYNGSISVKFADGSEASSGELVKVTGVDGAFSHPGNASASFTAKGEGNAVVTASFTASTEYFLYEYNKIHIINNERSTEPIVIANFTKTVFIGITLLPAFIGSAKHRFASTANSSRHKPILIIILLILLFIIFFRRFSCSF